MSIYLEYVDYERPLRQSVLYSYDTSTALKPKLHYAALENNFVIQLLTYVCEQSLENGSKSHIYIYVVVFHVAT